MSILTAFFCGLIFATLADSVADYISALAQKIEAQAECMKLEAQAKARDSLKGEKENNAA